MSDDATPPPLCPYPLMHYERDELHYHIPDDSTCALLNDPPGFREGAFDDEEYGYPDDGGDREANERENDAIERGAEMWKRDD